MDIIKILLSTGYDYVELSKYHEEDNTIHFEKYLLSETTNVIFHYIMSGDMHLEFKNNIIEIAKEYVKTSEYHEVKNKIYEPLASDIFSQIVCVSDNYHSVMC